MIKITTCPECGSLLERVNDQLFCRGTTCPAQGTAKLLAFAKKMKIKGLGEKTLEKLPIEKIADIYSLSQDEIVACIGEALGHKLYAEIEASRTVDFATFLSALSIPMIGDVSAKKIADTCSSLAEISPHTCASAGLGPKATESLLHHVKLVDVLPITFTSTAKTTVPTKGTVCITGKFPNHTRDSVAKLLESLGYKTVASINKSTTYLVCNEDATSSKATKAKDLGIPIIKLEVLLNEQTTKMD
jgi:DNA ligase (NAD+)